MGAPSLSPYKDLFDSLPDDFKEDITIVRRTKTGANGYNKPVYSEATDVVSGRFQIIDANDRTVEEGGIKDITQARVFFHLDTIINETDLFEVRGKRWAQLKAGLQTHLQWELIVQEVIPP